MSDIGKLYRDASMLAMRKRQVNRLQQENGRIRNETIEECAEYLESLSYYKHAAAIRALKDKQL